MYFKIILLMLCFCLSVGDCEMPSKELLTLNMLNEEILPRNFRMSTTVPYNLPGQYLPSFEGLGELNASASGQFSAASLKALIRTIPMKEIIIIDLREEAHGFINGIAVSWRDEHNWLNKDREIEDLLADEQERLDALLHQANIRIDADDFYLNEAIESVRSEEDVVEAEGLSYLRLPLTDHVRPSDRAVNHFILIARSLSEKQWVHFHCSAGRGRATTLLTMYDMLNNGTSVSYNDILMRQWIIGGKDLTEIPPLNSWKRLYHCERLDFLKQFYRYCREADWRTTLWTDFKT